MRTLDVHPIIDNARFTPFHWMVMAWCGLLLIFDGYDLFIYGVVLPVIMKEWGLTPLQAGALGSYALFGMMFGALAFGSLADRIGRKKGIAICFALFSGRPSSMALPATRASLASTASSPAWAVAA